jgi:hypothetical protein
MLDWTISADNRDGLFEKIRQLNPLVLWTCTIREKKSKRTLQQNKWARKFASEFGKHIGYEPDEAYDLLMYKCNPAFKIDPETGQEIRMAGHFSGLNTANAADVQESMIRFCAGLGFYFDEE